jgi:hypothetical protein
MSTSDTLELLNRLLIVHHRSLAAYLTYAVPWIATGKEDTGALIASIGLQNKQMADRIGGMVLESHGRVEYGHFPMTFTSLHDVSADYLLTLLLPRQQRLIQVIESIVDDLRLAPVAQALAQEALGEAKAHLDQLTEVSKLPALQR